MSIIYYLCSRSTAPSGQSPRSCSPSLLRGQHPAGRSPRKPSPAYAGAPSFESPNFTAFLPQCHAQWTQLAPLFFLEVGLFWFFLKFLYSCLIAIGYTLAQHTLLSLIAIISRPGLGPTEPTVRISPRKGEKANLNSPPSGFAFNLEMKSVYLFQKVTCPFSSFLALTFILYCNYFILSLVQYNVVSTVMLFNVATQTWQVT